MFAARSSRRPLPAGRPFEVLAAAAHLLGPGLPHRGVGGPAALALVRRVLDEYGADLTSPFSAAHLQPPPLAVAVEADALASASNASLDTYDSGPATIAVERWVLGALVELAGFGAGDGVFTPGGTLSNLTALLLARDAAAARHGLDAREEGVAGLPDPVVFCSELAHFSVLRACAALGLGERAVRPVPVDARRRMRVDALEASLRLGGTPVAVVATAGTTDFGSVDPLPELAELAHEYGTWLHVDAAYGFGALFSDRLRGLVDGIAAADSVTADLHKIGWQPAAAGVLLVRDPDVFRALDRSVAYLNPEDDRAEGYDGTLGRTLQTTRRPDAVKVAATLLALGRAGLGALLDRCHDLAVRAARLIAADPSFDLVGEATLTTVVFRYRPADESRSDGVNAELRRVLLRRGSALVGRTRVDKATCLKFTLLNPEAREADLAALLALVREAGAAAERTLEEGAA
ncbi:aminotransferase class V-fold PLP-dependent enzyme [Saccharothrix violaceirubra]|uniref:L-2,4-diaminobutyrate decarboxylase n=1 Tax=Saccharothrix violaceirubra TaxID=413306 RepID=A0A7W7T107_9PSEU|nr:aminotransferase class V-fold PLP-dependent enzyme [Saccharothrix violaceirubra]MBB4964573.1 L-2,4-diaminobutyrate decarboxylase [Saccharothrix violaceirubra]